MSVARTMLKSGLLTRFFYYRPYSRPGHGLLPLCSSCIARYMSHDTIETPKPYIITTPIFYVNNVPHLGHMHTAVLADVIARWQRIKGNTVIYSTGTDEHGMKIQKSAEINNQTPQAHCNSISKEFQRLFALANISHTDFIRTTEERHITAVQHFWQRLVDAGHMYKGSYAGWYCVSDEAFLGEDEVTEISDKEGKRVKVSKESGHLVDWLEEENYMFRLTNFRGDLLHWLQNDVIKPVKFQAIIVRLVEESLQDLSVSRSRMRQSWGIPVPGDDTQTMYVWLDALVNYLTAGGYPSPGYKWPADCHVVGKDILKFHAVYWPAFLVAAGLEPPREILCHSHWLVDGVKMSKSLQNIVNPFNMMDEYTVDGMRYFLVREAVPHSDSNYSDNKVRKVLNSELANTLGNMLSRCTSKAINAGQQFPAFDPSLFDEVASEKDRVMWEQLQHIPLIVDKHYLEYNIYKGIAAIQSQLRLTSEYFDEHKPWIMCKQKDQTAALNNLLYICMETLRKLAILLQPIVPATARKTLDQLNVPLDLRTFADSQQLFKGGVQLKENLSGPLFKRIKISK